MTATELYQAGRLNDAVLAALDDVKTHPTDVGRRFFLSELLCFAGEFERADKQLEVIFKQATEIAMRANLFRHLIAGEICRQAFFREGRLPAFLGEPSPAIQKRLEASVELRDGSQSDATRLLEEADKLQATLVGVCDGVPFEGLRDLDDQVSGVFEVITSTGKYFWVPMERVQRIAFQPPQRAVDLIWREAQIVVTDGPDGVVYVPTLYAPFSTQADEQLRLGRGTDWVGGDDEVIRGRGLRMFLVGEVDRSIMELKELTIGNT